MDVVEPTGLLVHVGGAAVVTVGPSARNLRHITEAAAKALLVVSVARHASQDCRSRVVGQRRAVGQFR